MNKQYINRVKYAPGDPGFAQFSQDGGTTWINSDPANPLPAFNQLVFLGEKNNNTGAIDYFYEVAPSGTFVPPVVAIIQKQKFLVTEDLLYDVFTSKYMANGGDYYGLPTPSMSFTFNISPVLNKLFKVSNDAVTDVTVQINSMQLNVLTYNHGALDIIPRPYMIPYYTEKMDQQVVQLASNVVNPDRQFAPIQYNAMPHYILFYTNEPTQTGVAQNKQMNLNVTEMTSIELTINNDGGAALYKMTKRELQQRTLTNLNDHFDNDFALFRTHPNISQDLAVTIPGLAGLVAPANAERATQKVVYPDVKPYLDGMFLLKIGKDIRINPQMMSGLNTPTNFNFKISYGNQYNRYFVGAACTFTTVAFFPGTYHISPTEGLIKLQNITVSEQDMLQMIDTTNTDIIRGTQYENNVEYTHKQPLMIGSGWFGALASQMPKIDAGRRMGTDTSHVVGGRAKRR